MLRADLLDHETIGKLHCLCTGSTELSRDDDLATLCARLHDESEYTVGSSSDSETTEQLVLQGLALSDGRQSSVLDLLGIELYGSFCKLESLLNQRGEFTDAATLLSEDLLGVGSTDDDLGSGVGDADLAARVALVGELAGEELGQLAAQRGYTISASPSICAAPASTRTHAKKTPSATNFLRLEMTWLPAIVLLYVLL